MDSLNNHFNEALLELRNYRAFGSSDKLLQKLLSQLNKFEKEIRKLSDMQRMLFIEENKPALRDMKILLLEKDIKMNTKLSISLSVNTSRTNNKLISVHDKLFGPNKLLEYDYNKDIVYLNIPKIFQEFIKGITYFSDQEPSQDIIYHRLYSCGEKGSAFYDFLHKCTPDMSEIQRNENEKRIYTCYIERLIFDNIFLHITHFFPEKGDDIHKQNPTHEARIQKTKEDFKTCFPNIDIEIEIVYNQIYPVSLKILKYVKNKLHYTEIYYKELSREIGKIYDNTTKCVVEKSSGLYGTYRTFDIKLPYRKIDIEHQANEKALMNFVKENIEYEPDTRITYQHIYKHKI